jgi:hypothetical protein
MIQTRASSDVERPLEIVEILVLKVAVMLEASDEAGGDAELSRGRADLGSIARSRGREETLQCRLWNQSLACGGVDAILRLVLCRRWIVRVGVGEVFAWAVEEVPRLMQCREPEVIVASVSPAQLNYRSIGCRPGDRLAPEREKPRHAGPSLMRRRGLEPPPGYPGPGPQPGASTNSAIGAGEGRSIALVRAPFASVLTPRYRFEQMFASPSRTEE